jgi:hypothetical protein
VGGGAVADRDQSTPGPHAVLEHGARGTEAAAPAATEAGLTTTAPVVAAAPAAPRAGQTGLIGPGAPHPGLPAPRGAVLVAADPAPGTEDVGRGASPDQAAAAARAVADEVPRAAPAAAGDEHPVVQIGPADAHVGCAPPPALAPEPTVAAAAEAPGPMWFWPSAEQDRVDRAAHAADVDRDRVTGRDCDRGRGDRRAPVEGLLG